ncbi:MULTISPECIES: hypothetical protein [Bacillus cereus group]|uniref:hypothetical protein n=1 Tax=Bacillus cereus group TaxID=86661 RepID=UPI0018F5CAF3|nr:hypothetical protein [Bacillus cereus]MBJ8037024.1 hypothetical protein [Bacillus cereus]
MESEKIYKRLSEKYGFDYEGLKIDPALLLHHIYVTGDGDLISLNSELKSKSIVMFKLHRKQMPKELYDF